MLNRILKHALRSQPMSVRTRIVCKHRNRSHPGSDSYFGLERHPQQRTYPSSWQPIIQQRNSAVHEAQTDQSPAMLQSGNDGHDAIIHPGNHDSLSPINVHIADLHASDYIIR